jgi:hypothetical protein
MWPSTKEQSMDKKSQSFDQVVKGGALGVVVYLCDKYNVDPTLTALLMPLAAYALALASTKVGDPSVASFLAKKPETTKEKAKK